MQKKVVHFWGVDGGGEGERCVKFSLVSIYSQTYEHSNVKGGGGRGGGRGTGKEHDKDKSKKSGNNRGNNSFQGKRFPGERCCIYCINVSSS